MKMEKKRRTRNKEQSPAPRDRRNSVSKAKDNPISKKPPIGAERMDANHGYKVNGIMKVFVYQLVIGFALHTVTFGVPVHSLYTDHRAMKVDDILTVFIVEEAKAGSKTGTNTSKENEMGVSGLDGSGALDFLPSFGASGGFKNAYDGKAGTSREGSLVARVSARVIKVLDNGNLMIEGSKVVEINEEREIIKISGVVRPQDIEADNIIYSHSVADAEITYSGNGTVHKGHRPGLVTKFLNWIF